MKYRVISGGQLPTPLPPVVGLDVETSGDGSGLLHPAHTQLTTVQIAVTPDRVYVIDRDFEQIPKFNSTIFVGQNLQFDIPQLEHHLGLTVTSVFDIMVGQGLIDAANEPKHRLRHHDLGELTLHHLGEKRDKSVRDDFVRGRTLTPEMLRYAALDASDVLRIREKQLPLLSSCQSPTIVKLEMKAVPAFAWVSYNGLRLNKRKWCARDARRRERLTEIDIEASKELTGGVRMSIFGETPSVNLNSHPVLKRLLNDNGIEAPNTQRDTLEVLYLEYSKGSWEREVLEKLSERSVLQKAVSNYGRNWLPQISPITGRVHSSIFQTKAATGRLVSADPNIMNVPKLEEFRDCFVPKRGNVMIRADYSQQEARIMAHLSGDKKLLQAFYDKIDPYLVVARYMFRNHSLERNDPERDVAKQIVLALFFGMGIKSLSYRLGVTVDEANGYFERFRADFPGANEFAIEAINSAEKLGYAETILGRRRFADQFSGGFTGEMRNHPVQGSAADMMKLAVILLYQEFCNTSVQLVNVVHDETVIESPDGIVIDVLNRIENCMLKAAEMVVDVPFEVGVTIGKHWGDDSILAEGEL